MRPSCLNINDPGIANLIARYGEDKAKAMYMQATQGNKVLIEVNGKMVESKLFNDILTRHAGNYIPAWEEYVQYMLNPDTEAGLDPNGEPEYIMVDPVTNERVTPAEIQERKAREMDILGRQLGKKVAALEKRIEKSLEKNKGDARTIKFLDLMDQYKDDASKLNIIKFMYYSNGYTHAMDNKLTEAYVQNALISQDILRDIDDFNTFLTLTDDMKDLETIVRSDPKTEQFLRDEKLMDTLRGIMSRREAVQRTINDIGKQYVTHVLANKSQRMHTLFREEQRSKFIRDNITGKNLSKQQRRALLDTMQEEVEKAVQKNKKMLRQQEIDYVTKVARATRETVNFAQSWMYDAHSMNDDLIQYMAQQIESAEQDIREETDVKVREMIPIFKEFQKAVGRRKTLERQYDEILEDRLELDENGNPKPKRGGGFNTVKGKKSRYFVSRYYSQFEEIHKEKTDRINALHEDNKGNEASVLEQELQTWLADNAIVNQETGEVTPNQKWVNPQYDIMMSLEKKGSPIFRMYEALLRAQFEADQKLPMPDSMGLKYKIPQLEKGFYESRESEGWRHALGLAWKRYSTARADDTEFGARDSVDSLDAFNRELLEQGVQRIPLFYRADVELNNLSYDLASTVMNNYYNSSNFARKQQVKSEAEIIKRVAKDRKILSGKGRVLAYKKGDELDPHIEVFEREGKMYSKHMTEYKEGSQSHAFKALQSYIEDNVYGKATVGNPNLVKWGNNLIGYTGSLMLSFNYASAIRNSLQGNIQNFLEANSGGLITRKDLAVAWGEYFGKGGVGNLAKMLGDIGKVKPESKTGQLIERFNALSEWNVMDRKFSNSEAWKQLMRGSRLNFMNSMAEHHIQTTLMYAVLNSEKILDDSGKEITMLSAYEMKNGELVVKDGVTISAEKEAQVGMKIRDLKKRTQGNYDPNTRAMIQRYMMGKFFIMFRRWMAEFTARRYRGMTWETFKNPEANRGAGRYYNYSTGEFQEGTYFTVYRYLRGLISDARKYKTDLSRYQLANWNSISAEDRANIVRGASELILMLGMGLLAGNLKKLADDADDEDKKGMEFLAYLAGSLTDELSFFINPRATTKLVRNPSAVLKPLENVMDMGDLTLDFIQGKPSTYTEGRLSGQNKFWYKMTDMTPVYRGAWKFDPEFANQFVFKD